MKQEDKELLLKDLCARLPYDVYVRRYVYTTSTDAIESVELFDLVWLKELYAEEAEFMPYLFPLSSMTEEQSKEYHELISGMFGTSALINFEVLEDFFHKNHLDYRGLIEKGLALNATNLNIY